MIKLKFWVLIFFLLLLKPFPVFAQDPSFVSIVNPIRGSDFWENKQKIEEAVIGEAQILKQFNLPATWLLRFDALASQDILKSIAQTDEKGLFLEVTPTWAKNAGIAYHTSSSWHAAGSAFLTGYETNEREKLIDAAFEKFKEIYGTFPKSVGAWWIDSFSLNYMQTKYGIISALIVADQYSTDNYQIWGQYFSTPYYPDKENDLRPAQTIQNKIPVVISQWAARDPVNAYGNGVSESTFSVQANDYLDYHKLTTDYFLKLLDIYTSQKFNQFGSLVVGLENTYDWSKYKDEYKNQIEALSKKSRRSLTVISLKEFAVWYKFTFPDLSPPHLIVAGDPLGSDKKAVWFMNPYYRAGWFYNKDGSVFRDIRQYLEGEKEICLDKRCEMVNFATSATRVLDDVSFGQKLIIDQGKISDFKVFKEGEKFVITYKNEAGNSRRIEFLPRDISVDGKISSIDGTILDAVKRDLADQKKQSEFKRDKFNWNAFIVTVEVIKFLAFLTAACLLPGLILINKLFEKDSPEFKKIFLGVIIGAVFLTLIFYVTSLLNLRFLVIFYILLNLFLFIKFKLLSTLKVVFPKLESFNLISILVILAGTIFQNTPTFKSGLVFSFGMGFWGPNTHDGVWHLSLINQLIKSVPVQDPIFSSTILKNYHFFYDLLIAATAFFTRIPTLDLLFRFYPILFSLLLGTGTYYFAINLCKELNIVKAKVAIIFSLYFVYFAGSFGWIVDYIKQRSFAGESAFWANQSISFNLNPPFAISLLIIIALLQLIDNKRINSVRGTIVVVLLTGSLVGFKSYGAVLFLMTLIIMAVINVFKKDFSYIYFSIFSLILSFLIFFSNFQIGQQLMMFSPFWFVNSMIDSPDRVGWTRLALARIVGLETRNWFKYISAEVISLLIFILGNLGMRILSIFSLLRIKSIIKNSNQLFLLTFFLLSFLIPILFIQSGNPWNTIQFSYYGLYIAAVISGLVVSSFILNLPKKLSILIILVIVILTPINSITTASYYSYFLPHGRIDKKELEALDFLSKQNEGVVLTYPYDEKLKKTEAQPWPLFVYDSTAYVSALSKQVVYLEDEAQNQILLTDYKKRLVASKDFFSNPAKNHQFLKENNIKYLYLPKVYKVFLDQLANVKVVFENEEVIIYGVAS